MMIRQPRLVFLAWLVAIAIAVFPTVSFGLSVDQVPNPRTTGSGWITDEAEVLSAETEVLLNRRITQFEAETGAEIAIVTVPHIDGAANPRGFGRKLFNRWGIGKAESNNGVLLLLSIGDRRVEILTGRGIESILTNAEAQDIIDTKMLPLLRREQYDRAMLGSTNAVMRELRGQADFWSWLPFATAMPLAVVGPSLFSGLLLIGAFVFGFKSITYQRSQADQSGPQSTAARFAEPPQAVLDLATSSAEIEAQRAYYIREAQRAYHQTRLQSDQTLQRFHSLTFFCCTLGLTSLTFALVAYFVPKLLAAALGLSIPLAFLGKNVPRVWRSPTYSMGDLLLSFLCTFMFFGTVLGLLGSAFVADAEAPIAPIYAILLALGVTAFTTIDWRDYEDKSSSRSRSSSGAGGYGGSSASGGGGSSGGSSGGGGFGGGSSDGGGAGGSW